MLIANKLQFSNMYKLRLLYLFFLLSVLSFASYAQENPKIDQKTFFTNQDGYENAMKWFKTAERYYRKGKGTYDEALKNYLKLYGYNSNSHALNYKIGICYLLSSDKDASLKYLLNSSPEIAKDYYLVLGRSYQYNIDYDKAKEAYGNYLNSLKKWQQNEQKQRIDQYITECDYSRKLTKDSLDVFIVNLGPIINTYYDEYSAFLPPNDSNIFFTSKRPKKEPSKTVSRFKYKEKIFLANNCIYQPCEWVSSLKALNKNSNVSMAGVDKTENRIFFYEGKWQTGRLLMTRYDPKKKKWKDIKQVKGKINHIAYRETSISIGPDNTAYFITDRRGSVGGKDIWVADYKRKDKWGKPYNIGNGLNTPFDEESIFISDDGKTLYFSSKGHLGMGGFDVYKSFRQIDGSWSNPINLGHPINSPADELFYHPTRDSMVALYSTIRADSYGGLDIYKIQIDPRKPFSLIGSVSDAETGDIISATVNIIDNKTEKPFIAVQVDTLAGIYMVSFNDIGDYSLQIDKEGYRSIIDTINCPNEKHATIVLDYEMDLIKHPFTLSGFITDVDSFEPIMASVIFKDANTDSIYARQYSDSLGRYSVTFEDKYNMVVHVEAEDYFTVFDSIDATIEESSIITNNISMKRSKILYTLTGVISDETSTNVVHGALSFYRAGENEPFSIVVSDSSNGKYTASIEDQGPFLIEVEASGYFFLNETYKFPENQTFTAKNFLLKKMSTGAKIVVENILFNSGKSTLKAASFKGLDKLAILLIRNPNVRIEVSGHTDNVGSASVNKRISKARALTVKNYLSSRGVEEDRIEYEGYGFDQPIAPNDTPEGKAQNRRVEIKVLN